MMKLFALAIFMFGLLLLAGCPKFEHLMFGDPAVKEVGLYGGQWMAYSTEELREMIFAECTRTCPAMSYRYEGSEYTVYEEGGMYVARDPKCICYDEAYAAKLDDLDLIN